MGLIRGSGEHDHRLECGDCIGYIGDCVLQDIQKRLFWMYFATDRPHHEGRFVGTFFGASVERLAGRSRTVIESAALAARKLRRLMVIHSVFVRP